MGVGAVICPSYISYARAVGDLRGSSSSVYPECRPHAGQPRPSYWTPENGKSVTLSSYKKLLGNSLLQLIRCPTSFARLYFTVSYAGETKLRIMNYHSNIHIIIPSSQGLILFPLIAYYWGFFLLNSRMNTWIYSPLPRGIQPLEENLKKVTESLFSICWYTSGRFASRGPCSCWGLAGALLCTCSDTWAVVGHTCFSDCIRPKKSFGLALLWPPQMVLEIQ